MLPVCHVREVLIQNIYLFLAPQHTGHITKGVNHAQQADSNQLVTTNHDNIVEVISSKLVNLRT